MAFQVGKYLTEISSKPPPATALSSKAHCSIHPGMGTSKSPCPRFPTARGGAPLCFASVFFRVAGSSQPPLDSRSPMAYTQGEDREQWGWQLGPVSHLLHLPLRSPHLNAFYLHLWTPSGIFLPSLWSVDNPLCSLSFSLSSFQPGLTGRIHLFPFQKLSVTNTSAKGLVQAARGWWWDRHLNCSLCPSATSLYELMLKLFEVFNTNPRELVLKKINP